MLSDDVPICSGTLVWNLGGITIWIMWSNGNCSNSRGSVLVHKPSFDIRIEGRFSRMPQHLLNLMNNHLTLYIFYNFIKLLAMTRFSCQASVLQRQGTFNKKDPSWARLLQTKKHTIFWPLPWLPLSTTLPALCNVMCCQVLTFSRRDSTMQLHYSNVTFQS